MGIGIRRMSSKMLDFMRNTDYSQSADNFIEKNTVILDSKVMRQYVWMDSNIVEVTDDKYNQIVVGLRCFYAVGSRGCIS